MTEAAPPARVAARIGSATADSVFLAVLVLVPVALTVRGLGFYTDDWAFLSFLAHAPDHSVYGLAHLQYAQSDNIRPRPTQAVYQAVLFALFHRRPLGYHLVNAAVLVAMTLLLYRVLRELGLRRVLPVSIAAVYGLLPNYSSDRYYLAAFGYALTMAFYLLSLYADLRVTRTRGRGWIGWKAAALAALAIAGFGYEVVLPLLFLDVALFCLYLRRRWATGGAPFPLRSWQAATCVATSLAALVAITIFKAHTAVGASHEDMTYLVKRLVAGTVLLNFGTYGIGLPRSTWVIVRQLDATELAAGALLGLAVFAYLARLARPAGELPSLRRWLLVPAAGIGVFVLGYAVFLTTYRISFSSTGIANRTGIAGALGAAIVLVGVLALPAFALPAAARRWWHAAAVAALCVSGFFIVTGLGDYWERAWTDERTVLRQVRADLPRPPHGSTILVHGVCPYTGPAIVFESSWDLAGALQLAYGDPTLSADVTTDRLAVGRRSFSTVIYGSIRTTYSYDRLLLVDVPRRLVRRIPDARSLRRYLAAHAAPACPAGSPGSGVTLFPYDDVFARLERRNFNL